jgi:hypothetical protein
MRKKTRYSFFSGETNIFLKILIILIEIFFALTKNLFVSGSHRTINNTSRKQRKKLIIKGILTPYHRSRPPMAGPIINHSPNIAPKSQKLAVRSLWSTEISLRIDCIELIFHAAAPFTILASR